MFSSRYHKWKSKKKKKWHVNLNLKKQILLEEILILFNWIKNSWLKYKRGKTFNSKPISFLRNVAMA